MQIEPKTARRVSAQESSPKAPRPQSESLIVHVLFIDLVAYSKLSMEKQYEASCDLSECVQETNTYKRALATGIVTCMDTGDGMVLAFEGNPLTPANLSLEIAHARGFSPNRPIRMGLHSGPAMRVVDINGRPNYKGVGINVAQRVMDCAIGGQITMTEHYASILRSYDGWAERIASRGTHTVKHRLRLRICELLHPFAPKQPMKAVLSRDLPAVPALVRRLGIAVVLGASFLNFWFLAPWPNAAKDSGQNSALPDISKPFKPPPPDPATQARLDRENAEAAKPFLGVPSGPSDIDPGLVEHSYTRATPNELQQKYGLSSTIDPDTGLLVPNPNVRAQPAKADSK